VEILVQTFHELVIAHCGQQWRLADYARALHVSVGHLRASCAKVAGISPTKLVQECVMREAKRRLGSGRLPVSSIARDLGFDDAAYFSRLFHAKCGLSPKQYRLSSVQDLELAELGRRNQAGDSHAMPSKAHIAALAPIPRNTLQEQVHLQIRRGLIDGEFKPGQVLTIRDLASRLGTSIMPVREALQKLTVERALELMPTRSVRVPILSAESFAEICEARIILEGEMTRLAAQRADANDIARMEEVSRAFSSVEAGSPTQLNRLNREFHFAVYAGAHHGTLMGLIEPLWVRSGPCTLALFEELGPEQVKRGASAHHLQALDAIRSRRPSEAQAAIAQDIRATSDRYQKQRRKIEISR
jgi:DNA-binding GntR family transcriptional regulator/AraC-like DNA-binding protein